LSDRASYKGLFLVFLRPTLPKKSIENKLPLFSETSRNLQQIDLRVILSKSFKKPFKIDLKVDVFCAPKKNMAENRESSDSDGDLPIADLYGLNEMVDVDQNADVGAAIAVRCLAV
jgi:hypothetical protein